MNSTVKIVLIAFCAGVGGSYVGNHFFDGGQRPNAEPQFNNVKFDSPSQGIAAPTSYSSDPIVSEAPVDFSLAASKATPSVVYINSISEGVTYNPFDWFFGESSGKQTQVSSGSGVIFTSDGYIVTNNHVVESAEKIEVNYNKHVYPAELIGTDPSADLAVIKIKENNLPAIALSSSKNVQVGEWVIAVGNPFSLASTVTAGIVSAKGRRIGILEDKFPIESFIQTDAAINPGNSGGALVNKNGELIGINTAILSRTGSYTGYAFAVPVDIAKKVFDDIVKYGIVQKAFFGGNVTDYNFESAKKYDLNTNVKDFNGVLVERLEKEGPAMDSGIKLGDIIIKVNGKDVNTQSAFEEELSYHYPGDKIDITYLRNDRPQTVHLTLVNRNGGTDVIRRKITDAPELGAKLESTEYGVKVFGISDKSVLRTIGVPENFTIIAINRVRVKDPEEVTDFFKKFKGRGEVYGVNTSKQQLQIPFILR
jgi:Do/DeqQ family serine protease